MWSHMQAHWFANESSLCEYMEPNRHFAEVSRLNVYFYNIVLVDIDNPHRIYHIDRGMDSIFQPDTLLLHTMLVFIQSMSLCINAGRRSGIFKSRVQKNIRRFDQTTNVEVSYTRGSRCFFWTSLFSILFCFSYNCFFTFRCCQDKPVDFSLTPISLKNTPEEEQSWMIRLLEAVYFGHSYLTRWNIYLFLMNNFTFLYPLFLKWSLNFFMLHRLWCCSLFPTVSYLHDTLLQLW